MPANGRWDLIRRLKVKMSFKTAHSVLEPSSCALSCLDQDTEFTEFRRKKKKRENQIYGCNGKKHFPPHLSAVKVWEIFLLKYQP